MDLSGVFRDGHPHLALELPGNPLENDPLMGTEFLAGYQLEIALTEGSEVSANPL